MNNLLSMALKIIPPTPVKYYSASGVVRNSMGIISPVFSDPVTVKDALVQPVNSEMYAQYGLTIGKEYKILHIKADIEGVNRKLTGDKIEYNGKKYTVVDVKNHYEYNGWDRLIIAEEKD